MWGRAMGGAPQLLPLLLLLPGAVGLECLSCGTEDGTCREATNVTCPPESDVCAEALAAVTWSHGRFSLGGRGCGRGAAGANARALELFGLVLFARRRQCRGGGGCNRNLPLGLEGALPLPANESARVPNGVLCYGCPDDGPCPPTTVVQCYDDLRGCFHGNVTLTLGGVTLWREVRGCVRDQSCTREARGDAAVGLRGSCCAGDLCNRQLANRSFFAPDLPRLELLPQGHAPTATPNTTKMAAGTAQTKGDLKEGDAAAKMAATRAKMAATRAKMAATRANMAAGSTGVTAAVSLADVNSANANMAAVDPNMAAVDRDVAAVDPNMAALDPNMAALDPNVAAVDPNMAALDPAGDKMAAGRAASGEGRPLERKDGIKGPVGRGHPIAGPGWLLPFLLLPLL